MSHSVKKDVSETEQKRAAQINKDNVERHQKPDNKPLYRFLCLEYFFRVFSKVITMI